MMWPFKKKEKTIAVPLAWAQELSKMCDQVCYGYNLNEFTPHEIVGYASNIKNFIYEQK